MYQTDVDVEAWSDYSDSTQRLIFTDIYFGLRDQIHHKALSKQTKASIASSYSRPYDTPLICSTSIYSSGGA